jgi:hypothetical protein
LATTVDPHDVPGWLDGWHPSHLTATTGHAHADLALHTGDPDHLDQAHEMLTLAAEHLTGVRPRAAALALTHLARAHRAYGNHDQAAKLTTQAGHLATSPPHHRQRGWPHGRRVTTTLTTLIDQPVESAST